MSTVDTYLPSQFSQQTLDLQKDFCCSDTDNRKIIRWVGCKPGVYRGQKTLFSSEDFALCGWYQEVNNYQFATVLLDPGETYQIKINASYIFMKTVWPTDSLDSLKNLEVGLNNQGGFVGSTIPFFIEAPTTPVYNYSIVRDLFHINTSSSISDIALNNISPYICAVSILYAS